MDLINNHSIGHVICKYLTKTLIKSYDNKEINYEMLLKSILATQKILNDIKFI